VRSGRFEFGTVGSVWATGGQGIRACLRDISSARPDNQERTSDDIKSWELGAPVVSPQVAAGGPVVLQLATAVVASTRAFSRGFLGADWAAMPDTPPDPEQNVDYEDRVLVYLDVLAWAELIKQSVDDEDARRALAEISSRLCVTVDAMHHSLKKGEDFYGIRVSQFSDLLVVSSPAASASALSAIVLIAIGTAQVVMKHGHYVRGAIVRGKLIHRPNVIYGPALVEAYDIERKVANYPRIIVAPSAQTALHDLKPKAAHFMLDDGDGMRFLNVLTPSFCAAAEREAMQRHVKSRTEQDSGDLGLVAKHSWMMSYLRAIEDMVRSGTMKQLKKDPTPAG
jgi:hypothetical protein